MSIPASRLLRKVPLYVVCSLVACVPISGTPLASDGYAMCVARGLGSQRNLIDAGKEVLLHAERRELKVRMKEQWGDLTNDDLDAIDGTREQLLGLLQRRYGYARERAEAEFKRVVECWSPKEDRPGSTDPLPQNPVAAARSK